MILKVKCDCNCRHSTAWKQKVGGRILNLCYKHHLILRAKVSQDIEIETNNDVLEWLLQQPASISKAISFSIYMIGKKTYGKTV